MPFIPHTPLETQAMLQAIRHHSLDDLFSEIPPALIANDFSALPQGMNELGLLQLARVRAENMQRKKCFIGAGAYEHHIPAMVWDLTLRGEYLTAYTPYQAEASQGTLQLLWEYQTMMASLMGQEVSNASLYDGATSLMEAVLMGLRCNQNKAQQEVWVPLNIHPHYRAVLKSLLEVQGIRIVELPYDAKTGTLTLAILEKVRQERDASCAVLVLGQPNFFGQCESVHAVTDWAHENGALLVGVVNPILMGFLAPPGQWGARGADIACGEGQPLGAPLWGGGPYFGFLCTRLALVRQMPGRVVGRTIDAQGKEGFTLTLQAREQHIRREKAKSNICTNQGLLVTAAAIYMSVMGADGLKGVAQTCYAHTHQLVEALLQIKGVERTFQGPYFHEVVLSLPVQAAKVIHAMREHNIAPGFALGRAYASMKNHLLVCVTETKTQGEIHEYADRLQYCLGKIVE